VVHRSGNDAPLARRHGEQLRAALVRLVVAVEGADHYRAVAGVDSYICNSGGPSGRGKHDAYCLAG
jgi:hypothetical protein